MNHRSVRADAVVLALLLLLASFAAPPPAAAYVDPLSGSILLQVVAAGFLATAFTLKRFWYRAAERVRGLRGRTPQQ